MARDNSVLPLIFIGAGAYFLFFRGSAASMPMVAPPRSTGAIPRLKTVTGGDPYTVWLQKSLNQLIGCGLTIDGIMGPKTKACLSKWQATWGIIPSGEVTTETDYYLKSALGMPGYTEQPYTSPGGEY